MQNLMLMTHAMGLGGVLCPCCCMLPLHGMLCLQLCACRGLHTRVHAGYWASWVETAREHPNFKTYLGLQPEDRCLGVFMLGQPGPSAAGYRASRQPIASKTEWRV